MQIKTVKAVFFSPTGGTKQVVGRLAQMLGDFLEKEVSMVDLTLPAARQETYHFSAEDLVILGCPVYAGRVPNKILPDLERCLAGTDTPVIVVSTFGNRSFQDGLMELKLLAEANGFLPLAAGAFVCEHAFSKTLAAGRPDEADLEQLAQFAKAIERKLKSRGGDWKIVPKGNDPVGPYYTPLQEDHTPAKFLKAKPVTDPALCDSCKICVSICPMASIDPEDPGLVPGICIKCQACVKHCPKGAKTFVDPQFLSHVRMLETSYRRREQNYTCL